jgi:hypothetical protein
LQASNGGGEYPPMPRVVTAARIVGGAGQSGVRMAWSVFTALFEAWAIDGLRWPFLRHPE